MTALAALAIFSGLSLNLLLQFALGTAGVAGDALPKGESARNIPFFQYGIHFAAVLILWTFFTCILPPVWRGFAEYFLFFPLSALICMGLERLGGRIFLKLPPPDLSGPRVFTKVFSAVTAYNGLVLVSLVVTVALADSFTEAFVFVLFFVLGNLTAMLILNEIRRRSTLERVPRWLRGSPLVLISMGLLSAVCASVAVICFRILETY